MIVLVILVLSSALVTSSRSFSDEAGAVKQTLVNYAAAIQSKNMSEIEKYVVTTDAFTIEISSFKQDPSLRFALFRMTIARYLPILKQPLSQVLMTNKAVL